MRPVLVVVAVDAAPVAYREEMSLQIVVVIHANHFVHLISSNKYARAPVRQRQRSV